MTSRIPDSFRPTPSPTSPVGQKLVIWIIWSAIFVGVFAFRQFLQPAEIERSSPLGDNQALMFIFLLGPALVSVAIRILVVPRSQESARVLVSMIAGIAIAEGLTFFGLFLFPGHRDVFFGTSVALILLYFPLFIRVDPAGDAHGGDPFRSSRGA